MGAIVINSPYSGRPVKVREQDIGRAVRDEEGRIFYIVQRSDGTGYYSAMTRKGSQREEQAYDEMATKGVTAKVSGAAQSAQQVHDATGRRRSNIRGKLVILVLLLLVAALGYLAWKYKDAWQKSPAPPAEIPVDPAPPETAPPAEPQGVLPVNPPAQAQLPGATPDVSNVVHLIHQDAVDGRRRFETPSGLHVVIDHEPQPGALRAARNQVVVVHYKGFLPDGTLIADSQRDRYERFALAETDIIPGLVEGITGMAIGERRTITIPPSLAYGPRGVGELIPPNATLRYEVELVAIK